MIKAKRYYRSASNMQPPYWVVIVTVITLLLLSIHTCHAKTTKQCDTIPCNVECIQEFVEQTTTSSSVVKMYCIYKDDKNNILDLIAVPKTTWDYICMCKKHGIQPSLALRIVDGYIVSIIKYKRKYYVEKSNGKRTTNTSSNK